MWFADLFQHRRIKKEGEQSNALKALTVQYDRVQKALVARRAADPRGLRRNDRDSNRD